MEVEINLKELYRIIKKKLIFIITITLIGLLLAAFYTFFITTPKYSSTTQLIVNRTQQTEAIQRSDIETNVQLISTYQDIIIGPVILDDVREELELEASHNELSDQITVSNQSNSQVFSILVTDTNPYRAATIANTTATVFQEKLNDIMSIDNVTIISSAEPNMNPISPNHTINLVVGILLGGAVGVGLSLILALLDNTVKEESFIVEELNWTSLGRISEMTAEELKSDGRLALPERTENYRVTRSRV